MTLDREFVKKMVDITETPAEMRYHMIVEEFGEMGQAMSKFKRHKDTMLHVVEEAMDLIVVTYSWLISMGVPDESIEEFINEKIGRAVYRYLDHGEQ